MKQTLLIFLALAALASGHHGWAAFDAKTEVTLTGTVTDFHFVNPHSVVEFEVKDDKGQIQKWKGELSSPSHLVPRGWTATTVEPGDELSITGYCAKGGVHSMWVNKIRLANGKELRLENNRE